MATVAAKSATGAIIGAGQKNMLGCVWPAMATTVKLEDPRVIEIAKFAVAQAGVVFINVEFGFWWNVEVPVGNVKGYMLTIKTQDASGTHCDVALVSDTVSDTVVGGVHTYAVIWYNHKNN